MSEQKTTWSDKPLTDKDLEVCRSPTCALSYVSDTPLSQEKWCWTVARTQIRVASPSVCRWSWKKLSTSWMTATYLLPERTVIPHSSPNRSVMFLLFNHIVSPFWKFTCVFTRYTAAIFLGVSSVCTQTKPCIFDKSIHVTKLRTQHLWDSDMQVQIELPSKALFVCTSWTFHHFKELDQWK